MSFFVDANALLYAKDGPNAPAFRLVDAVVEGTADGRTSVGTIEELWHLELQGRIPGIDGIAAHYLGVFSPLIPVREQELTLALTLSETGAGSWDRIHIATCITNGIDSIVSADKALDAYPQVRRIDPLDDGAVAELLA